MQILTGMDLVVLAFGASFLQLQFAVVVVCSFLSPFLFDHRQFSGHHGHP